jgi:flagellar hook-associated protein 2
MGIVGLSFGSPTSGAGFDVSTTVSEIVGNLQNVETPWKTQLTTLESQDTAISSLGTLFSNLSNDMSSLTDLEGILAEKTGSSSNTNVLTLTAANSTAVAGTHTVTVTSLAQTSSGSLAEITKSSDTLSGAITLKVGSGTAQTITLDSSDNTLAGLASAINSSGAGITASVLTDSTGSRLSLVSGTSGANGGITASANSIADATTSSGTLAYTSSVTGADAQLTVDGVALTSASNTVSNLIPGVTFQLLAPSPSETTSAGTSLEQVQVIIGNGNTDVESTVNQFVSDYNSLISAMSTQEGNDSSGTPEPLFGSPTLSLLQQQLLSGLNLQNPNGTLAAVSTTTDTTLSGSMTIQVGSGTAENIVIGAEPSSGAAADTIYTGSGSDYNTLSGLASAITSAGIGVTASVVTSNGESTLTLASQTAGSSGALTVTSSISATSDTALSASVMAGSDAVTSTDTSAVTSSATLTGISNEDDTLAGSISIQVGSGAAQTITVDTSSNTLATLADAINNTANIGVEASVVTDSDGTHLLLTSGTAGSAGTLTVTSSILDTTNTSTKTLNYTNSSDINSLTGLGISVNNNGSLTLDAESLDSVLNSDYSSVVGFFQNVDSWGQTFSNTLTNAGSSSATGILSLASKSNSSVESTLNAEISKENIYISAQQSSLTAELNSANEVMQELPTELDGINELYSAITGYDQNSNG